MRSALLLVVLSLSCALANLPTPYVCHSVGDPHISPFTTSPIPLYTPGVQAPGYFHLAGFGGTDVYAAQRACGSAYCNYRVAIMHGGNRVQIEHDRIKINASPVWTWMTGTTTIGTITVTRVATAAYQVTIPDGHVSVRGSSQDIIITNTMAPPPFQGLCAPPTTNIPIQNFLGNNHLPYSSAPNAPFGPETQAQYDAANPTSYPPYPTPVNPPNPQIDELANEACNPLHNDQIIVQHFQLLNIANIPALVRACREDVIILGDAEVAQSHYDGAHAKIALKAPQGSGIELPFSPSNTLAYGPGLEPQQTGPVFFYIQLRDALGRSVSQGGVSFDIQTTISSTVTFTIDYLGSGLYQVLYSAVQGTYTVTVSANGGRNNVLGAPFTVSL